MKALTCPKCGAPVELPDESELLSCPYCASTLAPTRAVPRAGCLNSASRDCAPPPSDRTGDVHR